MTGVSIKSSSTWIHIFLFCGSLIVHVFLGHSREISCFTSTARTDFLIVQLLKTQYSYICAASALNTVIEALENTVETWPCLHINSCVLLCFYSCVLLILRPPALIFSHFQDEKQDNSFYGLRVCNTSIEKRTNTKHVIDALAKYPVLNIVSCPDPS